MVKTYTVALAATAILFSVAPALAYEHQYEYEARDLVDYSEHVARDLSDFYLESREPEMDFESLYARANDDKDHKHKRPSFFRRPKRKTRKSKLVVLKKTCAKLEGKDKDECTKEFKEINKKTTEVLKKYREVGKKAKKAKADKKKKEEEERKKKKAEEDKRKEEERKKKKEEEEKKKKEEAEKKKKEEEEKKKKNKREEYDDLLERAYDEELDSRSYFDLEELD